MRVVQIVSQMEAAGVQRVAYLLHEGLCNRGHDSQLWFLYKKRPTYVGIPGVSSILDHCPSTRENFAITLELYRRLRQNRPDAVLTHTPYANVLEQTIAAVVGIPKRIAVHHNPLSSYPWPARVADCVLGITGVYSAVVAVSEAVRRSTPSCLGRYSKLTNRIHNSVEPAGQVDKSDVRRTWGIPPDKPMLLSVGRLCRQKNHGTLFQALSQIPDAYLVVAGDGDLAAESRRQVDSLSLSERVVFTGEINQEAVYALMSCADLFVLPSLWEGLPMVALEAMTRGMPTVASDIPPNREVFGDAALFVPPTDGASLASAIIRVLRDTSLSNELHSRALNRARSFSIEAFVNQYEQLLSSI